MRTITVDFSSDNPIQPFYGGEYGENAAVTLHVIPSTDMSEDENIEFYYLAFKVDGGVMLSDVFTSADEINVALGSVITEQRKVYFQLIATSSDGEAVISKSPVVALFLGKSIEGDVIPDPTTGDTIYQQIAELGEMVEQLDMSQYATKVYVEETIPVTDVQDLSGTSLVSNKIATIPYVQVWDSGSTTKYTATEIWNMYQNGALLKYKQYNVIGVTFDETTSTTSLIVSVMTTYNSKQITIPTFYAVNVTGTTASNLTNIGYASKAPYTVVEENKLRNIEDYAQTNKVNDVQDYAGNSLLQNKTAILPHYVVDGDIEEYIGYAVMDESTTQGSYCNVKCYFYDGSTKLSQDISEGIFFLYASAVNTNESKIVRLSFNGGDYLTATVVVGDQTTNLRSYNCRTGDLFICEYKNSTVFIKGIIPTISRFGDYYTKDFVYNKGQTYSKTEVDNLIGSLANISFLIVQTLPTQNIQTNIIYLVPSSDPQTQNTYDEFIYIESTSSWEQIGSTAVDLTGYATESWVQSQGYVTSAVTDVQDSEGTSLVTSGVATIPEIPEIPTDEEMATVLADLTNFVTLSNIYVSSGGNILAD